jgi:hypothetical protein
VSAARPASWPTVFETTLGWIERHADRFLLGPAPEPAVQVARLKPLVELALACDLGLMACGGTAAAGARPEHARLLGLQERLREDLEDGRRPALLMRRSPPPEGVARSALASLAVILDRWGAAGAWPQPERPSAADAHPPWLTRIEVRTACHALGFGDPATRRGATPHGEPQLPHGATYALAHVIMFRTDFGREAGFTTEERTWLLAWMPIWQRQWAESRDVDALAELTIAARCLGQHRDSVAVPALILQAQEREGAVVGLHEAEVPVEAGPGLCSAWFQRRYHTTLVANMAAALSLVISPRDEARP